MQNVSLGGAFAKVPRLPLGTEVTLWFEVPSVDSIVEVDAVVQWSTDEGVGVQLRGLRARDSWALGKYLGALRH